MTHLPRFVLTTALAALFLAPAARAGTSPAPGGGTRAGSTVPARKPSKAVSHAVPAATPRPAAVSAEALALLEAVNATYRGFTTYDFAGNSHMIMMLGGTTQNADVPFRLAAARPARVRNEIMNPAMSFVNVSDGSKTWTYLPQTAQYTEKDAAPLTIAGASGSEIGTALASGTPIERYLSATHGLLSARVVGEVTIDLDGAPVRCAVVEAKYASPDSTRFAMSPNTFWIDRQRRLVLRDSVQVEMRGGPGGDSATMGTVTTFSRLSINEPLADSTFTFHPPEGVVKVAAFRAPGMTESVSPLVGKPAPNFTLTDLAGKKQSLAALKGKVVLIDFWATWCGPCRRELPTVVKLHKELAPRGLAVVAVNVGEPPATVRAFLTKNSVALPVWLDSNSVVQQQYGANSIPTLVVIDREGKVSAYKVGLREEADVRALLAEAGLK